MTAVLHNLSSHDDLAHPFCIFVLFVCREKLTRLYQEIA
jgi:hypothetical protein